MDKLLLEYPWISKIVTLSKDVGLDWLMMTCLALELSGGDPRCRTLDKEFLFDTLGPDSPLFAGYWDQGMPSINVIDLGTRWGLFQILGRVAVETGAFTGRLINFTDIGANVKAAVTIARNTIQKGGTEEDVIKYFGADPNRVYALMNESRHSITILLTIGLDDEELIEAPVVEA